MTRNKSLSKKMKLIKAMKQNRRIPLFVVAKTKRKVTYNPLTRNWRRSKLKLDE